MLKTPLYLICRCGCQFVELVNDGETTSERKLCDKCESTEASPGDEMRYERWRERARRMRREYDERE